MRPEGRVSPRSLHPARSFATITLQIAEMFSEEGGVRGRRALWARARPPNVHIGMATQVKVQHCEKNFPARLAAVAMGATRPVALRLLYCEIPAQALSPHIKLVLMRGCHGDAV